MSRIPSWPVIAPILWAAALAAAAPSADLAPINCDSCAEWNVVEPPFRVYGNTYYVGTHGLSSVLIATSRGLILIDGDLPQSAPLIAANIRTLGRRLEDLKWIAVSHAHFDHVGGVAALARMSGAQVVASPAGAAALRAGAPPADDPQASFGTSTHFPPVTTRAVEIGDGATVQLGDVTLTAHNTPGHTPGGTTWSWRSCEQDQCRDLVYADSLNPVSAPGFRYGNDPARVRQFRQSIAKVGNLPCDILVSAHPSFSHLFERRAARDGHPRDGNPLIDPSGCRSYAADASAKLDARLIDERPIEVAVTIDDLPRHGPQAPGKEPTKVAAALLAAFARHHLPPVYGFVNAGRLDQHPEDRAVLDAWVAAGQPLGNHTLTHADLNQVPLPAFIEEIDRDDARLAKLRRPGSPKLFRYPYLREGKTPEERAAVRAHLAARGYRIAQVTIDPYDWDYNETYVRCLAASSADAAAAVRASLLDEARIKLRWAVTAATTLVGRPVRHILLLHLGAIDADSIDALLTAYEGLGVRWISLDDAMADPVYGTDLPKSHGGAFLQQLFGGRGLTPSPMEPTPAPWRGRICLPLPPAPPTSKEVKR